MMPSSFEELQRRLKLEKYQLVGSHSAVKKCRWLHKSLTENMPCYKQRFYGIQSHRCLQISPSVFSCTLRCLFCWRLQPEDLKINWNETVIANSDSPGFIVDESIEAQRRILSGYKSHSEISREKYMEALNPKHAAISLTGEPTLYSNIGELISEFHSRKMTTFLVTNGTNPEILRRLSCEPSQLYVSLHAPNEENFNKTCRPHTSKAWSRVNSSLEILKSFSCPTALRLTLTRSLNLCDVEDYAELVNKAESTYVEVKAYMYLGYSRQRLSFEDMPSYSDIEAFAQKLSSLTGYSLIDKSQESRVALLSKRSKPKIISHTK